LPGPLSAGRIPADRDSRRTFDQLVTDTSATLRARLGDADAAAVETTPIELVVEEAPMLPEGWIDAIPTSSINPDATGGCRIVVYRLPIVTRASSAADLVESLSEVLAYRLAEAWGISPEDLT